MSDQSRAKTPEELRDEFLETCRSLADYWADVPKETCHERLQGLLHSVLCLIDGVNAGMPTAFDLVARPHPDDKAYHQAEGENWIEDGAVINDTMLHELLYVAGRPDRWGRQGTRDS